MQSQLAEEKEKVAHLNEQVQQEQSRKEQELKQTRDTHQSQISSLQEKIADLVSIIGHSQKMCLSLRIILLTKILQVRYFKT